jgi:hypothetical protein
VTFAVSIFDLFCFAIPGALQLSIVIYLVARLGLADVDALAAMPTVVLVVAGVVASYLLGRLCHPLGVQLERRLPFRRLSPDAARQEFLAKVPQAQNRAYVRADPALLLAAAETFNKEAAGEIGTMRAQSLMLRNTALALTLAAVVGLVELIVGGQRLLAGGCAALLLIAAVGMLREGRNLWHMSRLKTLETCFWISDIDRTLTGECTFADDSE